MNTTARCLTVLVLFGAASTVLAYPTRPIRLIVPYPPGGTSDDLARPLAQKLSESFGQQVVIDNRGGASGNIGAEAVARSPNDGYTMLFANTSHTINPSLFKRTGYNPEKDFAPITLVAATPLLLVVHPALPVRSVKNLIALARSRPGELTFMSAGIGSTAHLAGELFKSATNTNLVHVPYRGSGPGYVDLLSGQVSVSFAGIVPAMPHVKTERLRAVAVTSSNRSSVVPHIPTVSEAGLAGFEVSPWFGIVAPAGTAREIISKWHREIAAALQSPDIRQRWPAQGVNVLAAPPEKFSAFIASETRKWANVIQSARISAE